MEDSNFIDITFDNDISSISDSDIQKKNILNILEKKKSLIWDHFEGIGEKKHGYIGRCCKECGWQRKVGKVYKMVEHLVLKCLKVSGKVKNIFL